MSINGVEITTNQTHYHYKCFFQNLLSFNQSAKITNLHLAGWQDDKAYQSASDEGGEWTTDASILNNGLKNRISWFKTDYNSGSGPYRPSGYTFLAPFRHELHGVTKPIPPGIPIQFKLDRSPDSFSLMRINKVAKTQANEDTEKYKAIILSCILYVKVGHMSLPLYRELHAKLQHSPIRYFFRKLHMQVQSINGTSESVQTTILNPDKTYPVKIYFALVTTSAYIGQYELNPYCYRRYITFFK